MDAGRKRTIEITGYCNSFATCTARRFPNVTILFIKPSVHQTTKGAIMT